MKHWIGIDVSKATLDVALLDERGTLTAEIKVENTTRSVKTLLRRWTKEFAPVKGEYLVCLEPTGYYGHALLEVLVELEIPTWLAHPNDIKQSIGMTRGRATGWMRSGSPTTPVASKTSHGCSRLTS
ncbi:MAG: transposase [Flavobacteriales bacterium]|nr:transposase [Flavobacteriales bacterium]